MNQWKLSIWLFVAVLSLAATRARACGSGGYGSSTDYTAIFLVVGGAAVGVAAFDIGFTIHDLGGGPPSAASGVFEVLGGAPQAILFGAATVSSLNSPNSAGASLFFGAMTLWTAALTVHGVWAIGNAARPVSPGGYVEPAEPPHGPPETRPEPPPPSFQMAVSPTYVPLSPTSPAGFGVVGRF